MKSTGTTIDDTDKKIILLLERGKSHKEIGATLYLTVWTVEHKIRKMKRYYKCNSAIELVKYLNEKGLME